ncbi:zinc finger MYM-type protein 1-like protein [Canna indica]|uniref:Zinc finger MYM-type protein 1-like protein n=1 Tax=Canna indica TaxID=4628 RepID=A0AAQ3KG07_9LILI|nr:zinc finger MYM-type protein 1-like protein [Canna indica]
MIHVGVLIMPLASVILVLSLIVSLMNDIENDLNNTLARIAAAAYISYMMDNFEFGFLLHFMHLILGINFELSQALQRKDQSLANAIAFIRVVKHRLQDVRDSDFDSLLHETIDFCNKLESVIPNMKEAYCPN